MKTRIANVFIMLLLLVFVMPLAAQDIVPVPYTWESTGLAFLYPSDWDLPEDQGDALQLAEMLAEVPEIRPPSVPYIALTVNASNGATDFAPVLEAALREAGVQSGSVTAITMLGGDGQESSGTSSDGRYIGIGRAGNLPDGRMLLVIGHAPVEQAESFRAIYDLVASSLTSSNTVVQPPVEEEPEATEESDEFEIGEGESQYGVLWRTMRTFDEGEDAFLNLVGLAYAPNGMLYTYDYDLGLVQLEATTGNVLGIYANENIEEPGSIAADAAGTVYVSDIACGCIYIFSNSSWSGAPITGFIEYAPESIVINPSGLLYGTNEDDEGFISVLAFQNGAQVQSITLSEDVFLQPRLAVDNSGRVLVLTDDGSIVAVESNPTAPLFNIGTVSEIVLDFAVDPGGNLILLTEDQGIVVIDQQGNFIDQPGTLVDDTPQGAEMVFPTGLAVSPDGTIYFADSDGEFGAVVALSTIVPEGQIGGTELMINTSVQGTLDDDTPQQPWIFQGTAGQRITISAIDAGDGDLNLAITLLDPSGTEEAYNDDQEGTDLLYSTDAQIVDHALATSGQYTIVVDQIEGAGNYELGVKETQMITLQDGMVLQGTLGDVFAADRYEFQGEEGQVLNFTLRAQDSDALDTLLRVIGPQGDLIIENDDADDTELGSDSQALGVVLPESGTYIFEAGRFDGTGQYELTINIAQ
ncbi:MAG: hypothetical protein K8L99_06860 [Anaerolineae bacterium]|nr:hypothetical protein [Anaerolineae bacterium]